MRITYADNGGIMGSEKASVDRAQDLLNSKLVSLGLQVHDLSSAEEISILLGLELDGKKESHSSCERACLEVASSFAFHCRR